ncbi:SRPBCC family protein [Pseudoalteromonas luteoviolacea]|uniref:SRPBCC family protein n=1 Tax=Pseudoalteromonas luteoviolacea TaxID=43657 RepID=UPI001F2C3FE0|nr:SRPBCC family protein [Pseudoalteromonas luteoviolacea]MCF6441370.1 SRPBCC family protein [Pseudoalteromonas luteoviolacea]
MKTTNQTQRKAYATIPNTGTVYNDIEINAPASTAWSVVGNFSAFDRFTDGLERIEMLSDGEGAVRRKFFASGDFVIDQLTERDDASMSMHWNIILTSLDIRNLWEHIRVEPISEQQCRVVWEMAGEPKDSQTSQQQLETFLTDFAKAALKNVASLCVLETESA